MPAGTSDVRKEEGFLVRYIIRDLQEIDIGKGNPIEIGKFTKLYIW